MTEMVKTRTRKVAIYGKGGIGKPLVRMGLPIHDRIGAARLMHVGYRGTQQLLDRVANAVLAADQDADPVGYTHL